MITPPRKIFSVTAITREIKASLEDAFGEVWIEGEISNLRRPGSGHLYFTLKDENAQIRAVFFRGHQNTTRIELKDGLKVRVRGQVTVYERSGDYQVIVHLVEDAGLGKLQAAFEALKKKLKEEGLFDAERKKPLPELPRHIGIVTSPTGAAIRDILNILSRRFPNLHVLIAPVKVQGEGAAEQIVRGIDYLNERGGLDVLIIGRGGGSLEDLWCFNEEIVARAIARSRIPIISAVGHEIDFTISDFVADLRAPTPSAAAELVIGRKADFEERLHVLARRLERALKLKALEFRNRLLAAERSYVFREPHNLVRQFTERLNSLQMRMKHGLTSAGRQQQQRIDELQMRMAHQLEFRRKAATQEVRRLEAQLKALSPRAVLERGFTITRLETGEIIRDVRRVEMGATLVTDTAHGIIKSTVTDKTGEQDHG